MKSPNRSNEIARSRRALDEKHGEQPARPFRGWHARGYLPHCDKPGLIQFVTFRLDDAMPTERRHEWEALREIEDERERQTRLEAYLDHGYGCCHLKDPRVAGLIEQAFHCHDAERYRLCAWVVMPNHVHVLFEEWETPMEKVLYSWKRFTATRANALLGLNGRFWQPEYWDRYMRDEEHFNKARRYIESNPVKAGVCAGAADWPWSSANPKWSWSLEEGPSRYMGGHVASANWTKFVERARGVGATGAHPPMPG